MFGLCVVLLDVDGRFDEAPCCEAFHCKNNPLIYLTTCFVVSNCNRVLFSHIVQLMIISVVVFFFRRLQIFKKVSLYYSFESAPINDGIIY